MKSIYLFSHAHFSKEHYRANLGEAVHAEKFYQLLKENYPIHPVIDIYQLFANEHLLETYEKYCQINLALSELKQEMIEHSNSLILKNWTMPKESLLIFLSWNVNLAGFYATGLHRDHRLVAKLYVFHENEKIHPQIYEPAHFIITESLLANLKGIEYGIPSYKMLYIPHHYPKEIENHTFDRSIIIKEKLLQRLTELKKIPYHPEAIVIGAVCRIQYRKNVEYILNALKKLHKKHSPILFYFILKGDLDPTGEWQSSYSYFNWIKKVMEDFEKEPWLIWDKSFTPYKECLENYYPAFDIALHLSGAEGASNSVVDMLSLGIPTIVLNASTNPFLFKEGAIFIEKDALCPGPLPFYLPNENDFFHKLESLVLNQSERKQWSEKAKKVAAKRFSFQNTLDRMPLLIEAAYHLHDEKIQKKVTCQFQNDLKEYGL